MPKEGLTSRQWRERLHQFAKGKFTFGRGQHPPKGSSWAKEIAKIQTCPWHSGLKKDALGRVTSCNCGYHISSFSSASHTIQRQSEATPQGPKPSSLSSATPTHTVEQQIGASPQGPKPSSLSSATLTPTVQQEIEALPQGPKPSTLSSATPTHSVQQQVGDLPQGPKSSSFSSAAHSVLQQSEVLAQGPKRHPVTESSITPLPSSTKLSFARFKQGKTRSADIRPVTTTLAASTSTTAAEEGGVEGMFQVPLPRAPSQTSVSVSSCTSPASSSVDNRSLPSGEPSTSQLRRSAPDYTLRIPGEWRSNMLVEDQRWIGRALFVKKGELITETSLRNWWFPPPPPAPNATNTPFPERYYRRRLFLWMPKRMWKVDLKCPRCTNPERSLQSKGLYTRVRLVMDVKDYYYLAAEYHYCTACKGTYIAWDKRLLNQLADGVRALFPIVLTYKYACDIAVVSLLRSRTLGNSSGALQHNIQELHSDEWLKKTTTYLSDCRRHQKGQKSFAGEVVEYKKAPTMKELPTAKWFLACYVRDVYTRAPLLKAAATSVFGRVLKIDSTKKVTKKLQGVDANSASWCTNIGNEKGEIMMSVLTTSESLDSLEPVAKGLMQRYSAAEKSPPEVLYTDRDCCTVVEGNSKFRVLFADWPDLQIRLDIWHFMRRFAVGCTSESHPLYGPFLGNLSRCIFEWDPEDVQLLYSAKAGELVKAGVRKPSEDAIKHAITKDEMALHCRRRTRGTERTTQLLEDLLRSLQYATDALGVSLFREEMLSEIWQEQRKHVVCIQDPPETTLYTVTGQLIKGGVKLQTLRCARGSTSLESFHLHLARFIPGTSASAVTYQACLLEGIVRWNATRASSSFMTSEKTPLRTFDMALQTRVNALSQVVHGEPLLPDFSPPRPYTGELFGVEFLRSQCGQARAEQDIDREIDEAFQEEDQSWNEADSVPEHQDDPTLALPDDGVVSTDEDTDRDSGNENEAVDAAGIPGWDVVNELATALLNLDTHVTNAQVEKVKAVYSRLHPFDQKALEFKPRYSKSKGRFKRGKRSAHEGTEAMARCFVTAGQPAFPPSRSRVVEAVCLRLCEEASEKKASGEEHYKSKWKIVVQRYNRIRQCVSNSRLYKETNLQLYSINETTVSKWFKNTVRLGEVRLLLQGLNQPQPPVVSSVPLPKPRTLPSSPERPPLHQQMDIEEAEDLVGLSTKKSKRKEAAASIAPDDAVPSTSSAEPSSGDLARTTAWRKRRKQMEEEQRSKAKDQGLPTPEKKRMVYSCSICKQPFTKESGHSQYFGHRYCPNAEGQVSKAEWLQQQQEQRKAAKAAQQE